MTKKPEALSFRTWIALALFFVWYGVIGHARATDWTSEFNLWTRSVAVSPGNWRAHINLAKALFGRGQETAALVEVGKSQDLYRPEVPGF